MRFRIILQKELEAETIESATTMAKEGLPEGFIIRNISVIKRKRF